MDSLDPDVVIGEQANKLPYDKKRWEFPQDKLKMGKHLPSDKYKVKTTYVSKSSMVQNILKKKLEISNKKKGRFWVVRPPHIVEIWFFVFETPLLCAFKLNNLWYDRYTSTLSNQLNYQNIRC